MLTPNKHHTGALPDKQDVIHFVISPDKGQFEQLGETLEERLAALKQLVREAAEKFVDVTWIAGIDLNTGIPHAHLAISRQH